MITKHLSGKELIDKKVLFLFSKVWIFKVVCEIEFKFILLQNIELIEVCIYIIQDSTLWSWVQNLLLLKAMLTVYSMFLMEV